MSLVISQGRIQRRVCEIFLHQIQKSIHYNKISLLAGGPYLMGDKIASHYYVTDIL